MTAPSDRIEPTVPGDHHPRSEFVARCLTSIFAVGDEQSIDELIEKSGLQAHDHDSPLCKHVYNLL